MYTDISSLVGQWTRYELTSDGKTLTLVADKSQVKFAGIVCINFLPASGQQQDDNDKEIYEARSYRLTDHRVPHAPTLANPSGTSVEIGPSHLRAYLCSDWNALRKLGGFYIHADYFSAVLICHQCELTPIVVSPGGAS